jgi:hypothetical protein
MQGEFTAFITLDESNKAFIEMYSFEENSIEPICPPFQLADTSHYEHLEVCCSSSRQILAVLLYNPQPSDVPQFRAFIVDFRRFKAEGMKVSEIAVNEVDSSMLARIGSDSIYDINMKFVNISH